LAPLPGLGICMHGNNKIKYAPLIMSKANTVLNYKICEPG